MSNLLPRNSPSSLVPHSCRKNILASILGGWVKSAYFTFEVFLVFFNIFFIPGNVYKIHTLPIKGQFSY